MVSSYVFTSTCSREAHSGSRALLSVSIRDAGNDLIMARDYGLPPLNAFGRHREL